MKAPRCFVALSLRSTTHEASAATLPAFRAKALLNACRTRSATGLVGGREAVRRIGSTPGPLYRDGLNPGLATDPIQARRVPRHMPERIIAARRGGLELARRSNVR